MKADNIRKTYRGETVGIVNIMTWPALTFSGDVPGLNSTAKERAR